MFTIIGGDGKEYGPVTVDQVRTWIAAGRANLDTQAKAAGSDEWRRLGDFPEFSGAPVPPIVGSAGTGPNAADRSVAAGRGARIGAAFINAFFYVICTMPGSMLMSRKLMEQNPEIARGEIPRLEDIDLTSMIEGQKWVWAGLLAGILLQAILLAVRGQNLGKMLVGVRVVRASDGQPAGFVRAALLRFLLPVLIMIALNRATGVLGFLFLLIDFCFIFREDGRCLHDLIAGTKVARK
jgi:hypothetical protein